MSVLVTIARASSSSDGWPPGSRKYRLVDPCQCESTGSSAR
jgi:hypothetical protein